MKNLKSNIKIILLVSVIALIVGIIIGKSSVKDKSGIKQKKETIEKQSQIKYWTCSMHPQIKAEKKGLCPICGMELIPVYNTTGTGDEGDWELTLSKNAIKLMSVETAEVRREDVFKTFNVFGQVAASEEKVFIVTSWFGGRIDKLYYEVEGDYLRKGSKIADIYSPEIYKAEKELIAAYNSLNNNKTYSKKYAKERYEAAKKKLKLLGLKESQIEKIVKRKEPALHVSVFAEQGGFILKKIASEGIYVKKGAPLYKIAPLDKLWVFFDIYESDLIWVKKGEKIEFTTDSYPGKVFIGKITFIDSTVDPRTRTVKVRANIDNKDGLLKPEMFVRGRVFAKIDFKGRVLENIKEKPLIIPLSAPLITGRRAVVYVQKKEGDFEGREIVLGPKTDKGYVVLAGLKEGEKVVVKGNFLIDSELQIRAKRSMMYDSGEAPATHNHSDMKMKKTKKIKKFKVNSEFSESARFLVNDYLKIQKALSRDNLKDAKKVSLSTLSKLKKIKMEKLSSPAHMEWMALQKTIKESLVGIGNSKSLNDAREFFEKLSEAVEKATKRFQLNQKPVYKYFCPMAFNNKGAYWLQEKEGTENPYFGKKMFKCGSEVEKLLPDNNGESK